MVKIKTYNIDDIKYKRIYGNNFITTISKECELAFYYKNEGYNDDEIAKNYFISGYRTFNRISEILVSLNLKLDNIKSFLDFASGFGRTTRFFVQKLNPNRITISDINKEAVNFQIKIFGVKGFISDKDPDNIDCKGKYQVIIVNSLFSHLNHNYWLRMLKKLFELLEPKGYLIFSTNGSYLFRKRNENFRRLLKLKSPEKDFYFISGNNTMKLDHNYYGCTFVTKSFVQKTIKNNQLGKLVQSYNPLYRFMGDQDVYVIHKV